MASVKLFPYQVEHYHRVISILLDNLVYVDTSETGAGKSIIAMKLAQYLGLPMFIICPTSMVDIWSALASTYKIKTISITSYGKISYTRNGNNPSHGFLESRFDKKFNFTDKFQEIVNEGILLIVDECQNCKNESQRSFAVRELIRSIAISSEGRSRIGLLSHTPTDKENIIPFLHLLGISKSRDIYKFQRTGFGFGEYILDGLQELQKYAQRKNPEVYNLLNDQFPILDRRTIPKYSQNLYDLIISPILTSNMTKGDFRTTLEGDKVKLSMFNLLCHVNESDSETIESSLKAIRIRVIEENMPSTSLARYLRIIELYKVPIFARLIEYSLGFSRNNKVIVFLNYTISIKLLNYLFQKYNPLILNGQIPAARRYPIIDSFQASSDKHRLLLCNTLVGGVGLDLDDTLGFFPRTILLSPSFNGIDLHQAMGRVDRANTKYSSIGYLVYAGNKEEQKLIDAIANKSNRLKKMARSNNIKLLGELPFIVESGEPKKVLQTRDMLMHKIIRLVEKYGLEIP